MDLDKSLDDILRGRNDGRRGNSTRGVQKSSRGRARDPPSSSSRSAGRAAGNGASSTSKPIVFPGSSGASASASTRETKIIVTNLPLDVTEAQVAELFRGHVGDEFKRAHLTYGPNGQSKGIATCILRSRQAADSVQREFDGRLVDGARKLKIELVLSSRDVGASTSTAAPVNGGRQPAARSSAPRQAAPTRDAQSARNVSGRGNDGRRNDSRQSGSKSGARSTARPKKTAEELDAEMQDYFEKKTA